MEIGGGFGGKFEPYGEPIAAVLSKMSHAPVKIVMTRTEEFESTGPTPGSYIKVKMGAKSDGTLVAATAYLAYEAGAFPGSPVGAAAECVFGPYSIENLQVDGFDVVVNKPKTAAYRAPGATNAEFASETVVDELAEKLGMDPIEIRLKNASTEGTRRADGTPFGNIGCVEVLEALRDHPHYTAPIEGENRGRGVAMGYWMNAGLQSAVNLAVNNDGTVALTEGSPDIGGTRTSISMQAAEVLGIPAEDFIPSVVDTDSIAWTFGTGGSRNDVRHRPGGLQGCAGREETDDRPRLPDLGRGRGLPRNGGRCRPVEDRLRAQDDLQGAGGRVERHRRADRRGAASSTRRGRAAHSPA